MAVIVTQKAERNGNLKLALCSCFLFYRSLTHLMHSGWQLRSVSCSQSNHEDASQLHRVLCGQKMRKGAGAERAALKNRSGGIHVPSTHTSVLKDWSKLLHCERWKKRRYKTCKTAWRSSCLNCCVFLPFCRLVFSLVFIFYQEQPTPFCLHVV